ncbi:MAG: VWA domain-containing protein [Candidatus Omnitrophota bacterium]
MIRAARRWTYYAADFSPAAKKGWDRLWLAALAFSVLLHAAFVMGSLSWRVSDIRQAEENVETLFRVKLENLESLNFVSRPTQLTLREERERILQQNIAALSDLPSRSAEPEIAALAAAPDANALPAWGDQTDEEQFVNDRTARNLITSKASDRAIDHLADTVDEKPLTNVAAPQRIALAGRGGGAGSRIMADLPPPAMDSEPAVAREFKANPRADLAPPAPDLNVSEPPIELPPVNEILPSPNLMRESPGPAELQNEEEAKEEIKDRYIRFDDLVSVELFTYRHIGGDGYFMIRIRPTTADERLRVLPKDVLFVLDASRSMGNRRLDVIKDEIVKMMSRLRPGDRFNVVGFKQSVKRFTADFDAVNGESLKQAEYFVRRLEASGKTDIYSSLNPLVQLGTERARPLIVLLYSDGRPTVGVVNSRRIINELTRFRGPSTSIFCVGTGSDLNRYLLDMLAFRNRGLVAFESDRNALPPVMESVYGYIEDPVLLKVTATFDTVDEREVYPKVLPDLYMKGELKIWGRLRDEKKIALRLVGEAFDERKEMIVELAVPERDNGTYDIARDWAFRKIYNLVGKMVEEGERPEYLQEIEQLSRTYRVVTPYSEQASR